MLSVFMDYCKTPMFIYIGPTQPMAVGNDASV